MRGLVILDVAPARPLSASNLRPGACTTTNTVHHTSEREGLEPKEGIPHSHFQEAAMNELIRKLD